MKETAEGNICRVIRTEVGKLAGASGAVILRVEYMPLGDGPADEKANVTVFILDRGQAATLNDQLVDSYAVITVSSSR